MYASALKCCGAMEVCGLGFPQDKPIEFQWPEVLEQAKAQRAGHLVCFSRDFKPQEAVFLGSVGFYIVSRFTNPRTGNALTMWVKDLTAPTCV